MSVANSMKHLFSRETQQFCLRFILSILLFISTQAIAYSPYSTKELEQLEKEFVEQINQSDSVMRDPLANQYINHLAGLLARHGQLAQPYFFIVKSQEINAFAGPGGYIGVNTALILATANESELAAVMAHEMSHVRLHHLYRMIEHQKQMQVPMLASMLAAIALGVVNPTLGSGALMASLSGFAQDNINFVRSNEKEADRIGIDMLIKSGLDPRGMANFFKKMQQNSRYYYTANIPAILRTHPLDEDRIAEAENRSAHLTTVSQKDSLDYHLFKELIRNSVTENTKQLIEYYQSECLKHSSMVACQYGHILALININKNTKAKEMLTLLLKEYPDNLYFTITEAQAEIGLEQYTQASLRLGQLHNNYPENYAAMMSYSASLIDAGKAQEAAKILLQGSRQFKADLPLCKQLARAAAASHRKDYAYFTEAQCQLLQGRKKDALRQLKLAKTLASKNSMLIDRITAKIDEVNFQLEK
jgi:predicted Zn-dependent protease